MTANSDDHLTDSALDALLGTHSDERLRIAAELHVSYCSECADRLHRVQALYADLRVLPQTSSADLVRPLVGSAKRSSERPAHWRRTAIIAAAASALFVAGSAVGALAVYRLSPQPASATESLASDPVLRVQEAGSAYTAALATLAQGDVQAIGREVVFSTLSGAVHEVAQLSTANEVQQLVASAERLRSHAIAPVTDARPQ